MRIYLAGFINGNTLQQCIEWRKRIVTHYLMRAWDIIWLDPMNGHAVGSITPEGFKSDIPGTAFVDRDIKCVEESDLIIANLDNFEEKRTPTGTLCEIAIAGYLRKPLIVITNDINYYEHPWIKDFASMIVSSIDELLEKEYINYFYKGKCSARYE